ncbi:MAG: bifunctional methylenetetrahydrofolate dehydrogenase/methenyltetrahydrofolate cyclohydrolase FolD [Tannerella sp.]|jgi:methylenetetrahydrofolate dehydrogenase (NADP+)/methenyltetrahydrofolate cyclohydrolase|nr:bifunctional methylenetetrahydrofolate dehydrogenase/methenyltetrahydrofolate cyclohydrolase FolD [Tannerella sp.]
MEYRLIDGKAVAAEIKKEIAGEVAGMKSCGHKTPHLAAVLVGHDGGSETYVANKVRTCGELGFKSSLIRYEDDVTEAELLRKVGELNDDEDIDGFIVQLPLPPHISSQKIIEAIDYRKDVDGFHPVNVGLLSLGLPCFKSATPAGIIELLRRYEIETRGRHCVVLGRSNIVGKPVASMMMQKAWPGDCTVTVCHSRSVNIRDICLEADILIAALGQPEFVKADMVKPGAVVIDVGTTRVPNPQAKNGYKLTGDVAFDQVAPRCSYITPVPGGVGPMTIISLMRNTLLAAKKEIFK